MINADPTNDAFDWDEYWADGGPHAPSSLADYGMHIEYNYVDEVPYVTGEDYDDDFVEVLSIVDDCDSLAM